MNSPQFRNEQKINNYDFLINYLLTSLLVFNEFLNKYKFNSIFLIKLFDNYCFFQSINFLPQYFLYEIHKCISFLDFCFPKTQMSNYLIQNKSVTNFQVEENNCFSNFNNNIENAFNDSNTYIIKQIEETYKNKSNQEDILSSNQKIICKNNELLFKKDVNKQNTAFPKVKKFYAYRENLSIKDDSLLNIEKKNKIDQDSKKNIFPKEENKIYNFIINGQKEEHKENPLKGYGSFISFKESNQPEILKQDSPFELDLNEEETDQETKVTRIFDIQKVKNKDKLCFLGYSFYSKGVLVTKPNEDFIKSRKFSDDSINKKIKANCFKCLNNILGDDTLFSQFMITNVGINFNKNLIENTIEEILMTALAQKYMSKSEIKEKINCVVSHNSFRQELLNLTFEDFYQNIFLKSKELESKLKKIEEKEPYIYLKKYEFRVKSFISYFKNNKGNNILKLYKKKSVL